MQAPFKVTGIDHVVFHVKDLVDAKKFYIDFLGMRACSGLKPPDITRSWRRWSNSRNLVDNFFSIMKIPYHNARRLEMCRAIVNTRTLMSCARRRRLSGDRRRRGRDLINKFFSSKFSLTRRTARINLASRRSEFSVREIAGGTR